MPAESNAKVSVQFERRDLDNLEAALSSYAHNNDFEDDVVESLDRLLAAVKDATVNHAR